MRTAVHELSFTHRVIELPRCMVVARCEAAGARRRGGMMYAYGYTHVHAWLHELWLLLLLLLCDECMGPCMHSRRHGWLRLCCAYRALYSIVQLYVAGARGRRRPASHRRAHARLHALAWRGGGPEQRKPHPAAACMSFDGLALRASTPNANHLRDEATTSGQAGRQAWAAQPALGWRHTSRQKQQRHLSVMI
jgi:hypothetical protein